MTEPLFLEWALKKVFIDLPADAIVKRLQKEINPALEKVKRDTSALYSELERDRVAEFKAGIELIHFGHFDSGFAALVKARHSNRFSPIAKLALAQFFLERNQQDEAFKLVSEAAELNPYLLSPEVCDENAPLAEVQWSVPLWEPNVTNRFRDGWLKRLIRGYSSLYISNVTAAISTASVCGQSVVVQFLLGENLRKHTDDNILRISAHDGMIVGTPMRNSGFELVFVSYQYMVVFDRKIERYLLLNLNSGKSVFEMSSEYFQDMFLGRETQALLPNFRRSTWSGLAPKEGYERSARFRVPRVEATDVTFSHTSGKPYVERTVLRDPLVADLPGVPVRNYWEHIHFAGAQGNMLGSCTLAGGGRVGSTKHLQNLPASSVPVGGERGPDEKTGGVKNQ